jgi:hypothetical protein
MKKHKYVFVNDERFDDMESGQKYIDQLIQNNLDNRPDDKKVKVKINSRKIKDARSLYLDVNFELIEKEE